MENPALNVHNNFVQNVILLKTYAPNVLLQHTSKMVFAFNARVVNLDKTKVVNHVQASV